MDRFIMIDNQIGCTLCGAIVHDRELHTEFHIKELQRMQEVDEQLTLLTIGMSLTLAT